MLPELHAFKVLFYDESVSVVPSGHVTKMAVTPFDPQLPKIPCYTQTWRLYLLYNRSYCRLKFYIAGIKNFAYFLRKLVENIKIFRSYRTSDADDAETHFLVHYRQFQLVCCRSYTHSIKVLFYAESVSVVTSGHVTKMAVTPFDPQLPKTPCYTQTWRLYLL